MTQKIKEEVREILENWKLMLLGFVIGIVLYYCVLKPFVIWLIWG